jgi:hypothetical protein
LQLPLSAYSQDRDWEAKEGAPRIYNGLLSAFRPPRRKEFRRVVHSHFLRGSIAVLVLARMIARSVDIVQQTQSDIGDFPVTEFLDENHSVLEPALRKRKSRFPRILLIVAMFTVMAAALTYVGLNSESLIRFAFSRAPSAVGEADAEDRVTQIDLKSVQQQLAELMQSRTEEVAAQRDELKHLSDQVAELATKVEAWQSAVSPPSVQTAASGLAAVPKASSTIAPLKKRTAAKPTGPISLGGAPLPIASAREEQH